MGVECARRLRALEVLPIIEREARQGVQGTMYIQETRICVDVHGEIDRAVSQGRLSRTWCDTAAAEVRSELVTHGVNIDRSSPLIALGNPGRRQIPIKDSNQT